MKEKIDYKKEFKDLYMPKATPSMVQVPRIKFIMVEGKGNPNSEAGEYQKAMEILYGLSFTIKMSKLSDHKLPGYFDYVVPPLEGLWWMKDMKGIDYTKKDEFHWISMIRQPEFVDKKIFEWSIQAAKQKKPEVEFEKARFMEWEEGLCLQMMHQGSYDDEPNTILQLEQYIKEKGLENAIGTKGKDGIIRMHHEIYLSDPRKAKPENLKTVIRIPVIQNEI